MNLPRRLALLAVAGAAFLLILYFAVSGIRRYVRYEGIGPALLDQRPKFAAVRVGKDAQGRLILEGSVKSSEELQDLKRFVRDHVGIGAEAERITSGVRISEKATGGPTRPMPPPGRRPR